MTLYSINPASAAEIGRFDEDTDARVDAKLDAAARAFRQWRDAGFTERGGLIRAVAEQVRGRADQLAVTITSEMGKPLDQAETEVVRFAERCEYFAEHAERMLAPERLDLDGTTHWICFEPLGPALGIMPWNYPLGQASRWLIPALMAGNTALLKHAPNVTITARALEEAFAAAGCPPGVFSALYVSADRLAPVLGDPRIASVSLTGSTAAGRSVGALAGGGLKKMVLELGGSDPFIVLPDADLHAAVGAVITGRFANNSGQACSAPKRFIVVDDVADEFEQRLVAETERLLRVGDPMDRATNVGPVARSDLLDNLNGQVAATVDAGALVATRLPPPDSPGFYFGPAVLVGVTPQMRAAREETFGPLACVIRVPDGAAAVEAANATEFGLAASVWTADRDAGLAMARDLECGMVGINSLAIADPRLPFGGIKASGFGRELSSHGMRELTNVRTIRGA